MNQRLFNRHLESEETVIRVVHRHWFLGLRHLFWPTITFCVFTALLLTSLKAEVLYVVGSLLGVVTIWWFRNFFDYYLDAWIITDTGIIDVEWHGWFHRQSARVLYSDIQGVSYEIQGILNTVLRYGTIGVEKVSTGTEISMDNVSNPRKVEAVILKNMEDYLHKRNLKDSKAVQDILSSVIARELQLGEFNKKTEDTKVKK